MVSAGGTDGADWECGSACPLVHVCSCADTCIFAFAGACMLRKDVYARMIAVLCVCWDVIFSTHGKSSKGESLGRSDGTFRATLRQTCGKHWRWWVHSQ